MSYTFLQEQGEVSSVHNYSDIPQCVLSKSKSIPERCCYNASETGYFPDSPSGTMYVHSMDAPGEIQLMLFAEDSLARIFPAAAKERELPDAVRAFGRSIKESLAKLGLNLSSRKTPRFCGVAGLTLCSETCPSWGIMQDGACWELGTSARLIGEIECGYLQTKRFVPTPMAQEAGSTSEGYGHCLNDVVKGRKGWDKIWPAPQSAKQETGGKLNPPWVEWLMGWPIGWTDLEPLETDRFQQWQQ